jgi:hypothetical protein
MWNDPRPRPPELAGPRLPQTPILQTPHGGQPAGPRAGQAGVNPSSLMMAALQNPAIRQLLEQMQAPQPQLQAPGLMMPQFQFQPYVPQLRGTGMFGGGRG